MSPKQKKLLAYVLLMAIFMGFTNVAINYLVYGAGQISVEIRAPSNVGSGGRPYEDGVMVAGRQYGYEVTIFLSNVGDANLTDITVYGDAIGTPEPGSNYTLSPRFGDTPRIVLPNGSVVDAQWDQNKGVAVFKIPVIKPGEEYQLRYYVDVPESVDRDYKVTLNIIVEIGETQQTYPKVVVITPPPMWREFLVIGLTLAAFLGLIILGKSGFFNLYTNVDLVTISMLAAAQVVWVQIIGRQLVFPVLDRIPMTYNFAVGDFPYILLLITAAMLVRKPGTVSLTLFIYNIVSEIGWYGLNPLWWPYPFAQGLVADLYMLLRGRAIFTEKLSFFKLKIPPEELEKLPTLKFLDLVDGFIIGFLRGLFMQLSLYLVFYPNLFHLYYAWGYAFYWVTIPWAIGNGIEGAISVRIAAKIEEALQY